MRYERKPTCCCRVFNVSSLLVAPQKSRWQMEAMRAEEYGQPYPQGAFKIGSERASKLQREKKTARQVLATFSEYLAVSEYREPQAHGFPE